MQKWSKNKALTFIFTLKILYVKINLINLQFKLGIKFNNFLN